MQQKHAALALSLLLLLTMPSISLAKNPFESCDGFFKTAGEAGEFSAASDCYVRAFPAYDGEKETNAFARAACNYAESLLAQGDYINGFINLDNRLHFRDPLQKPWNGESNNGSLQGITIKVFAEQGLGDTFFFLRYVKELKRLGATVIVVPQGALKKLVQDCPYIDRVVGRGDEVDFDYDVYMMSLPRYISSNGLEATKVSTIPNRGPYIYAQPDLVQYWANEFAHDTNFKIGICWRAGQQAAGQTRYLQRDIPLSLLAQLGSIPGVSLYSLQGPGHHPVRASDFEELKAKGELGSLDELDVIADDAPVINGFNITRKEPFMAGKWGPFKDDAAIMHNMHLIISVDTSVPNLSGAMYLPTWFLLPQQSDWRWLTDRTDSPWHPSATLFRQDAQNDWEPVMQRVIGEVKRIVSNR